ncbi:MAG: beta-ketoacyl-ACP synthase II [Eubacteriales bacterium]|nr:beta-ketoacyl-ACP synthase II [Eubacteriales bacterium]
MNKRVVVTGLGVVSPVGNNTEEFWDGIINGRNGIDKITLFDTTDYKATLAGEVKNLELSQYMDKGEARKLDRFSQFTMCAAEQAVKMSDITGKINPRRFGVYFGSGIGGFDTMITEYENLVNRGPSRVSPMMIPKMIVNISAGNIAIKYNAQGPCLSVVTACATGSSCIGEAYRAIKDGYADAIIAGGSEASINPLGVAGFINCMALSESADKDRASIPFDKERNGFVMGEGAGALVLEEYEHAKNRGAKIYAEVIGYGSTCDAYHITAPSPDGVGAANAISDSIADTGVYDSSKVYINAHGTSTPLNDKTETNAIKKVFGEDAYKVHISSTKSMTGHMLGAAGAVEAIAAILALKNNAVPPTIGYKVADEECDLDYTPNKALKTEINLALSVSLGFGGHNASLAFREIGDE